MKITNYEIYKLRKSGLTNQQILTVLGTFIGRYS